MSESAFFLFIREHRGERFCREKDKKMSPSLRKVTRHNAATGSCSLFLGTRLLQHFVRTSSMAVRLKDIFRLAPQQLLCVAASWVRGAARRAGRGGALLCHFSRAGVNGSMVAAHVPCHGLAARIRSLRVLRGTDSHPDSCSQTFFSQGCFSPTGPSVGLPLLSLNVWPSEVARSRALPCMCPCGSSISCLWPGVVVHTGHYYLDGEGAQRARE